MGGRTDGDGSAAQRPADRLHSGYTNHIAHRTRAHRAHHTPARPKHPPQLRYRNNSNYKNDSEIRKRAFVSQAVLDELKRIIEDSEVRVCVGGRWGRGCVSVVIVLQGGVAVAS